MSTGISRASLQRPPITAPSLTLPHKGGGNGSAGAANRNETTAFSPPPCGEGSGVGFC